MSVPAKGKTVTGVVRDAPTANNKDTYAVLSAAEQGGKSYVKDIGVKVITVADVATSRDDFIARLQQQGVGVVWSDARKYIVFEDLCRKKKGEKKYKIRDKKLSQYYNVTISKEGLEDGFKANTTKFTAAERARQQLDAGLDDSFRASQSRKQQLTSGTDSSFQTDTGLSDIRLAAQASTATYAVRERKRRADEEARERFEAARRENFKERKRGAGKGATSQQTNAKYTKNIQDAKDKAEKEAHQAVASRQARLDEHEKAVEERENKIEKELEDCRVEVLKTAEDNFNSRMLAVKERENAVAKREYAIKQDVSKRVDEAIKDTLKYLNVVIFVFICLIIFIGLKSGFWKSVADIIENYFEVLKVIYVYWSEPELTLGCGILLIISELLVILLTFLF